MRGIMLLILLCCTALPARSAEKQAGLSPQAALATLKDGNERFVQGFRRAHGAVDDMRRRLTRDGQHPVAAIIACSDSRESVEYIFDQPLGALFVIRTAGNAAGTQSLGSCQYAVEHLAVPLVIVMGHTHCGAVQAVVDGDNAAGHLAAMLEPIAQAAKECGAGRATKSAVTEQNVRHTVTALLDNDAILARRVTEGTVLIRGAMYDIETGTVRWLDERHAATGAR